MTIVALHGFLGRGADWDFLREAGFDVTSPDLFRSPTLPRLDDLRGDALLGYSLGGRLALHALLAGARFSRAVIVSAGLGIEEDAARAARRIIDERWAQRLEHDAWSDVLRDWNAQPLFGGRDLPRDERHYDRRALAAALREWSPAVLPPVASRLHELALPILFVAGADDAKYVAEAERAASLVQRGEVFIVEHAAHRVPWEQPRAFAARLRAFLD
jgi:2-succinyl-6-hydroxy-2,4-cyclohexadiene-1-carboxylate synthase